MHDSGSYYEVVCYFDDNIPESMEYAFKVENDVPGYWDRIAKINLQFDFDTKTSFYQMNSFFSNS